jgi:S1-C subfamily serine protease
VTTSRRLNARVVILALLGVLVLALTAGMASARTTASRLGTGVVIIDTNLGYSGGAAAGTGMVLTSSGEVLTNNHVVDGATSLRVTIPGTNKSYSARVLGYSVARDVALIKLKGASNLKTITRGNSSKLRVGQSVTALGNAGGTGSLTPARGKITGLDRTITAGDQQGGDSERLSGLIEVDAAVQPGDSGGPLLDSGGRVIGMDTAASTDQRFGFGEFSSSTNDAYAIPITQALSIAHQISIGKSSSTVHVGGTAWLGVEVESASDSSGGGYGYDPFGYGDGGSTQTSGALVAGVVTGGPAASAGLQQGDVITAVNGHAVDSPEALTTLLEHYRPGQKVTLSVSGQAGGAQTVTVTLGSGPAH